MSMILNNIFFCIVNSLISTTFFYWFCNAQFLQQTRYVELFAKKREIISRFVGNIPQKESYGVFVSQLIRYARCCDIFTDFETRTKILINRLTQQGFFKSKLKKTFSKFAETYYELLIKYDVNVCNAGFIKNG